MKSSSHGAIERHPAADEAVAVSGIVKRYGAVTALDGASFSVRPATIHALLGENGAGKSTMVKMLGGLVRPDAGSIRVFGSPAIMKAPRDAHALGLQTAFQELSLIGNLSVIRNMLLPYEPTSALGQLSWRRARDLVEEAFARLGLDDIDLDAEAGALRLPVRQKIEIAKAIIRRPRILILDEPTSALSGRDLDWLFTQMRLLHDNEVTIIFISHRLREVREFCDRITILRNGRDVGTFDTDAISDDEVVRLIIGRTLASAFPPKSETRAKKGQVLLATQGLSTDAGLSDVSCALSRHEILGVAGLQGMGQLPLFLALFGMQPPATGRIEVDGRPVSLNSPRDAINARIGISLLPEDRRTEGLVLALPGKKNVSLPVIDRFCRFGLIDGAREKQAVGQVLDALAVPRRALYQPSASFSGGNQQKMVMAKWLLAESRVWLMFDPTRGVDVGTKHEIYMLMRRFTESGGAILFYSSDVVELVNICDRVMVMYKGRIVRELEDDAITEENIMRAALGGESRDVADLTAPAAT